MTSNLVIKAGRAARAHILKNGLAPEDIRVVMGASGAAKWLSIYGLDRAIFSQWLRDLSHPVYLLGTSIGAWKLSAAAQKDPARALDRLKEAYISQTYRGRVTPDKIDFQSLKILNRVVPPEQIHEVLNHKFFRLGVGAVRCNGLMASKDRWAQVLGMITAFGLNFFSRNTQTLFFERTLFHGPGHDAEPYPLDLNGFSLNRTALGPGNFTRALMASGSIPVIMKGVRHIPGAGKGVYRDGGVLDYHPVFPMAQDRPGFILYPHFYPQVIPGWFDKNLPWRRAGREIMDRTILVAPSPNFIARLPYGRIPDRKDFIRFKGRDRLRYQVWQSAARMSLALGDEFLDRMRSGTLEDAVRPF